MNFKSAFTPKNHLRLMFVLLLSFGCQKESKVIIIKQWHLSPSQNTKDIEKSKSLPQFKNQKDIFQISLSKIQEGSKVIISEGCEGEIHDDFKPVFNGWSMSDLYKLRESSNYADVLAPVPMKIEALLREEVKTVCGDNLAQIKMNNLAMSDLRGYAGFYQRLKAAQESPTRFKAYATALEDSAKREIENPLEYTRAKAKEALDLSWELITKRNQSFLKAAKANLDANPIIIIGGLHAEHLGGLLRKEGIDYEIVTPKGYSAKDVELFEVLSKSLAKEEKQLVWLEVPQGFKPEHIQSKKLLNPKDIATKKEWSELESMAKEVGLAPSLLLSDYDQDGIRDFTLSSGASKIVLSAEDDDWDNDGIPNLSDNSLGESSYPSQIVEESQISNRFNLLNLDAKSLLSSLSKKNIQLLNPSGEKFDLLILKVISDALERAKIKPDQLRYFRISTPSVKYGKQVFFSYNATSLSIDIYLKDLLKHFSETKTKRFPNEEEAQVLKGYMLPLLYHSIAHELVHAMSPPFKDIARKDGWDFSDRAYLGKYLIKARLPRKMIKSTIENTRFKGKKSSELIKELQASPSVNQYLIKNQIPSLYALTSPSEWVAEKLSMCFIRSIYPDSNDPKKTEQYISLLGINPLLKDQKQCGDYFLK